MTQDSQQHRRSRLSPTQVSRGLRLLMWDGGLATVKMTLTAGAFLAGFALWLGASERLIGLIMALPWLAQAAQLFTPRILETVRSRRRFAWAFYAAGFTAWVPIAVLAHITPERLSRENALILLVALLAAEGVLAAIAVPAAVSLLSDIIPAPRRGRFFSKRNVLMAGIGMVVGVLGGRLLDFLGEPKGFAPVYLVGFVCGMGGVLCVALLPELPHVPPAKPLNVVQLWLRAWREPRFRELLIFTSAMRLSLMIAGPFFAVYMLEDLKLSYSTIAMYAALGQIASLGAMPLWGYLSDKFGHTPVLKLSSAAVVIAPFLWIPATADAHLIIPVAHIFANAVWAGMMLSQFNLLLAVMPEEHDAAYSGVFFGVTGLVAAVAPVIGGFVAEACSGMTAQIGFLQLRHLHFLFIIAACLRALSLLLFRPKHTEVRPTAAMFVLQRVVSSNPFRAFANIVAMQLSKDEPHRVKATKALGVSRTKLAVEELVDALNDASPDVRREAARALGEIGDERAVEPLLAKLSMPGEGIVDEAARALGKIGDPRSLAPLLRIAADPEQDVVVRSRAFLALGDLKAQEAIGPALAALEGGPLPLAASAATALSHLSEASSLAKIVGALRAADCPVARRQFAEAAARLIGKERQINNLFRCDTYAGQERIENILRSGLKLLARVIPDTSVQANKALARSVGEKYGESAYGELIQDIVPLARRAEQALNEQDAALKAGAARQTAQRASALLQALTDTARGPEPLEEESLLAVLAFAALTDALRSAHGAS